ncbi:HNH endonuclease [Pontiella agarivorans]|uniref:HNH endonuclease n=1 Tax=Pontiella agarivorans TaxID=3038953 RepID=A0ABU5MX85_9BACT|nr:HNH endonuclease [Pontiella agarivorans]MDZ8118821.1 HNH endonuclease [Pontiella agarivorans]
MARNPKWKRDEVILALDLYFKVEKSKINKNHPDIIALSKELQTLSIHAPEVRVDGFRSPGSVSMKMNNFLPFDPDYAGEGLPAGSKLDKEIWDEFFDSKKQLRKEASAIRAKTQKKSTEEFNEVSEEFTVSEGKKLMRKHRIRERKSIITQKKKKQVLEKSGKLECEICGFDFYAQYGDIGYGFAECHHTKPLSDLEKTTKTRLKDLCIVCANCHRMLHKKTPPYTKAEMKTIIHEWN